MKQKIIFLLFIFVIYNSKSQLPVGRDTICVQENSKVLKLAWAGGLNSCMFSQVDVDLDGKLDLVVFDKVNTFSHGILKCFINQGGVGLTNYIFDASYNSKFPTVEQWVMFYDYNSDGKADLFTYVPGGIKVFKNTSTVGNLSFQLYKTQLISNKTPTTTPSYSPIYSSNVSIPALSDIDNDGDLDLLTFGAGGYQIEYHKNRSKEIYGISDSLEFELFEKTWGDIYENNCNVQLNQYLTNTSPLENPQKTELHAGSCLMCFDRDGDGDKDLLMGDIFCNFNHYCENGGTPSNAHIIDTTALYPNYPLKANTTVIRMNNFPCTYYLDVDNDGFKDLIASPNAVNSENQNSVWYYKNISSTSVIDFQLVKKNFLQDEMIELGEGAYPVLFDVNNDGLLDMVIGNAGYYSGTIKNSQLNYYKNIGSLSQPSYSLITRDFANLSIQATTYTLTNLVPTFGDIDADGDNDMIVADFYGKLHWVENTAGASLPCNFSVFHYNYFGITTTNYSPYPQLIDVDRDGLLDLIIGLRNGQLAYYRNTGTASAAIFTLTSGNFGNVNVKGDPSKFGSDGSCAPFMFDDGGTYKLLCGSISGNIYYYDNIDGNLSGNFNKLDTNVNKINDGPQTAVQYVDINNDGKRDLIVGNYAGGLSFFSSKNAIGINELNNNRAFIKVFPNPTTGSFTIQGNKNEKLVLSDIYGRELFTVSLNFNTNYKSEIQNLQAGVYFLRSERSCQKIIVTK